ncbi:MAG: hypothetical protein AAGG44_06385, partial [Planctomycetota bacterium]
GGDNSSGTEPSASIQPAVETPSTVTVVENGVGTEPAQAAAVFLDSLRSGNVQAINGILTELAQQEVAKSSWGMEPVGTPEGRFEIGRVGYPYEDKSVALVECTWVEPPVPNETPVSMDIVCEVHKETAGWRISALAVTVPGTEDTLVLDFEDAAALDATVGAATQQTAQTGVNGQPAGSPQMQGGMQGASAYPASGSTSTPAQIPSYQQPQTNVPAGGNGYPPAGYNGSNGAQQGYGAGQTYQGGQLPPQNGQTPNYGAPTHSNTGNNGATTTGNLGYPALPGR